MRVYTSVSELRDVPHVAGAGFKCGQCGVVKEFGGTGCGTGYGHWPDSDAPVCYECCGKREREEMIATGRGTLYLSEVSPMQLRGSYRPARNCVLANWPGTLRIVGACRVGRHNIAGKRYDVWFTGPDGKNWHGVTYGDNTQICRVRRLKK